MIITIDDINKDQLRKWINLMDAYHGISVDDKSWLYNAESKANKITLYFFLIGQGLLYVIDQRLKCRINGYEALIEFVEEFFKGKSIVNFIDLFFLSGINQAFCQGKWHNVHQSWLIEREDYFEILESRKKRTFIELTSYCIQLSTVDKIHEVLYYWLLKKDKVIIINYFEESVFWRNVNYSTKDFKNEFN